MLRHEWIHSTHVVRMLNESAAGWKQNKTRTFSGWLLRAHTNTSLRLVLVSSGAPSPPPLHRSAVSIQHNNVRAVHSQGRIVLDVAAVVYGLFFSLTLSYCSRDFHCWEFVVSRTCIDALGSICVRGEPAGWDIRESKWIFGRFCWNIGETSKIYWIIYVRLWVCVCRWSVSGASHLVRSSQKFFLLVCLVRVRSSSRGFARQAVTPGFMQPTNLHIGRILLEDVLVFQMLLFCW